MQVQAEQNDKTRRFEKKLANLCSMYAPELSKHKKNWFTKSGKMQNTGEVHINFQNYRQPKIMNARKIYAEITYDGRGIRGGDRGYTSTLYITDKGIFSKNHRDNDLPDITWDKISSFRFSNEEPSIDGWGLLIFGYSLLADAMMTPENDMGGLVSYRLDPNDGFFTVPCEDCAVFLAKFLNDVKNLAEAHF